MISSSELADINNKLSQKKVKLFNPDSNDFTVNYHSLPQTIHAQEIEEFPHDIAQHIAKHLATHLLNIRGVRRGSNVQADLEAIRGEIFV